MDKLTLGEKISLIRTRKKLSKKQLGEKARIHWTTISKYEHNHISPSIEALKKIALVLETPTDFFIMDEFNPPKHFKDKELLALTDKVDNLKDKDREFIKSMIRSYFDNKAE